MVLQKPEGRHWSLDDVQDHLEEADSRQAFCALLRDSEDLFFIGKNTF